MTRPHITIRSIPSEYGEAARRALSAPDVDLADLLTPEGLAKARAAEQQLEHDTLEGKDERADT